MKKIIFTIMLILLMQGVVKAECTPEQISRLKKFASQISVTYDYEELENRVVFSVTFRNVYKDLKIYDKETRRTYSSNNEFSDFTISNIYLSGTHSYDILSNLNDCMDNKLITKHYVIPYYNFFYKDELCKGNESNVVCQKWSNTSSLTYTQLRNLLNKKTENDNIDNTPSTEQTQEIGILTQLFVEYYYVLYGAIIIVSLTIMIIINRKDRFNFNT